MLKFPPKRLLVPLDLSEPSLSALAAAKALARRWGAMLDLVHVRELPPAVGPAGLASWTVERRWNAEHQGVIEKMRLATADLPRTRVTARCLEGLAPVVVLRLAFKQPNSLIVMGTHGHTGIHRALSGSVAEAVVRHSNIPVLTVHSRTAPLRLRKILVPHNMTPYADRALRYAMALARQSKARVSALFIDDGAAAGGNPLFWFRGHLEQVLGKEAREVKALVRDEESVERGIVEEASAGKFDLIVLAAHRKLFLTDYTLGTTAMRVLRHSPIPVLSVPSVEARRPKGGRSLWPPANGTRSLEL